MRNQNQQNQQKINKQPRTDVNFFHDNEPLSVQQEIPWHRTLPGTRPRKGDSLFL